MAVAVLRKLLHPSSLAANSNSSKILEDIQMPPDGPPAEEHAGGAAGNAGVSASSKKDVGPPAVGGGGLWVSRRSRFLSKLTKVRPTGTSGSGGHRKKEKESESGAARGGGERQELASKRSAATEHARLVRTRRLMREFEEYSRASSGQITNGRYPQRVFSVELVDDNLYEWHVKLYHVDPDSELARDMEATGTRFILLNVTFPEDFPFAPPFLRVVSPPIERGFVMEGGAVCMELLTPSGWASAYTVEAIIVQFGASLVRGRGRIASVVSCASGSSSASKSSSSSKTAAAGGRNSKGFSRKAAEASFRSLVKTHDKYGWVTPPLADG